MQLSRRLNGIIEDAIKHNWNLLALADFDGKRFSYSEVAENIEKIHID